MFVRLGEGHLMENSFSIFCVAVLSAVHPAKASVNVTQHHNHDSRDGHYIDSFFLQAAAVN
jgi:hypothetical protein